MKPTSLNVPAYAGATQIKIPATTRASLQYWLCQLFGWILIFLINISSALYIPDGLRYFVPIALWSASTGLLVSHGWRHYLRRNKLLEQTFYFGLALQILAKLTIVSTIQLLLAYCAYVVVQPPGLDNHSLKWVPYAFLFWFFTYVAWTVFYATAIARRRVRDAELEKLRLEIHIKENELRALQAQINPHFFFNSLNSIRALIYHDTDAAAEMIDQLSTMMRYTLHVGQSDVVTLAQELAAVRSYLSIEKIRFAERIKIVENIDARFDQVTIPPMALQTLVENAVKYGVEQCIGECQIELRAQEKDNHIQIQVANQGVMVSAQNSTKLGINNISKRLHLLFGERASIAIAEQDGWVIATLLLPIP